MSEEVYEALRRRTGSANRGAEMQAPSFTGGTRREEMMWDYFKPEVEVEKVAEILPLSEQVDKDLYKAMDAVGVKDGTRLRGSVLHEAMQVINGERQDVYGAPEGSFALIGEYWGCYLRSKGYTVPKHDVQKEDVAMLMTLFKIAREANQHKRDNIVDAGGYLGIYADMAGAK